MGGPSLLVVFGVELNFTTKVVKTTALLLVSPTSDVDPDTVSRVTLQVLFGFLIFERNRSVFVIVGIWGDKV